jgi:hypothetical protein
MFLLLVSIPFCVNAQQHNFIGGVLVSINGIGLTGDSGQFWNSSKNKEGKGHGGVSAGIFVKREFTRKIYSTFELRYISKGSYYGFKNQYGTQSSKRLYLDYIVLPVLIGYKLKHEKKSFYFESGFAFSKLISSRIEGNNSNNTEGFKSTDILWIGSLKYPLIKKWQNNCLFGLRLSSSILTIHKYYKIYNLNYGIEFNYIFN